MNKLTIPKQLLDKRIPTILGIVVLVVALIAGTLFLGDSTGVFSPRATPETTPKRIRLTNVTDNSFTVSFLTDDSTPGFVKYGDSSNSIKSQASDDRDQLTGSVGSYQTHHITVRGLQQNTEYFYTLGTGSGATFDNNGQPFSVKTTSRSGVPSAAKTIHGSVSNETGTPANGAIVYITLENAGEMSTLVRSSGGWAVPLSNARILDGSAYAQIEDRDGILITVQGLQLNQVISLEILVSQAQPVPTLTFGQESVSQVVEPATPTIETEDFQDLDDEIGEELDGLLTDLEGDLDEFVDDSKRTSLLEGALKEEAITATKTLVDLEKVDEDQEVDTPQPKIIGKAAPNVVVSIEVNSEHQITQEVTADENGNFELDLSTLAANLEPGEHTVRYSYTDPETGEVVEKVVSFTVLDTSQQLAQAPFGTESPFPAPTASPTIVEEAEEEATPAAEATPEARADMPSTQAGVPVSGSVGTTLALVFGGLFFIISGIWSFWISHQLREEI